MTSELLASVAGIVLSLVFSYVPGLNKKFGGLQGEYKRLIMLGLLAVVGGAAFGLSCANLWPTVTCDQAGAQGLITAFILAVISNQATFTISPETKAVKLAKVVRDSDYNAVG